MLSPEAPREPRHPLEPVRPLRATALTVAAILALAGCGGDDDEDSASDPVATSELTITVDPDGPGGGDALEAEISCPGANAPPSACEALDGLPANAAAPVPASQPCTEIYGGPDVVTITGTLAGEEIDTELTRENGCEIERFERFGELIAALFPDYEPGASLAP